MMLLGWNPFFYYFIGGGIGPSLFVSYSYLQITSAIGGNIIAQSLHHHCAIIDAEALRVHGQPP